MAVWRAAAAWCGEQDRGPAVQSGQGSCLLGSVLRYSQIPDADRGPIEARDDQFVELPWIAQPPQGAQGLFLTGGSHIASRHVRVLPHNRVTDLRDGDFVGRQSVRMDPDMDGTLQPAPDLHFADALGSLQLKFHHLVSQFGELP